MIKTNSKIVALLAVFAVLFFFNSAFAAVTPDFTGDPDSDAEATSVDSSDETTDDSVDLETDTVASSSAENSAIVSQFTDAKNIVFDQKVVGEEIVFGTNIFFKIVGVTLGSQLAVTGNGSSEIQASENMNYLEFTLYDESGNMLSQGQNLADGTQEVSVFYYPGQEQAATKAKTVYLKVAATSELKEKIRAYELKATLKDVSDAGSKKDAGETISAGPVTVEDGIYKQNYLGINKCGTDKYCSTDEADTFKYSASANSKVSLTVKPGTTLGVKVMAMGIDGEIISEKTSVSEGQEIDMDITSYEERDIYFNISPIVSSKIKFGSYSMSLDSEEVAPLATNETDSAKPSVLTKIMQNKLLMYLGVAVVVVIVIMIVFFRVSGKRGKMPSKKSQEGADIVRKALKTKNEVVMRDPNIVSSEKSLRGDMHAFRNQANEESREEKLEQGNMMKPTQDIRPARRGFMGFGNRPASNPSRPKSSLGLETYSGPKRNDINPDDIDI